MTGRLSWNWNKSAKKKQFGVESSFFIPGIEVDEGELDKAKERFRVFNNGEMTDAGSVENVSADVRIGATGEKR